MNKFDVFVEVDDERWIKKIPDIEDVVIICQKVTVECVKNSVSFLKENKNFSVNLSLSNDQEVCLLNKEFRGKNMPTNVLSFANLDGDDFNQILKIENNIELGDVIVAFETVQQQAEEIGVSLKEHFCHLWVHGLLHVLGYDHIKEQDRIEMEAKEIEILEKLGFENPYKE